MGVNAPASRQARAKGPWTGNCWSRKRAQSQATAAKGEAFLAHAIKGLGELLEDMAAFDLSDFD